jgi:hypothetical protein
MYIVNLVIYEHVNKMIFESVMVYDLVCYETAEERVLMTNEQYTLLLPTMIMCQECQIYRG